MKPRRTRPRPQPADRRPNFALESPTKCTNCGQEFPTRGEAERHARECRPPALRPIRETWI